MRFELSQLITIGSIIAVLGGFYYNTQYRLDALEEQVQTLKKTINKKNRSKNK